MAFRSRRTRAAAPPRRLERFANPLASLIAHVAEGGGLEHDRQSVRRLRGEHLGQLFDEVAADELGRVGSERVDRPVETLEPFSLARPDEGAKEARPLLARDVDRRAVDPDPAAHGQLAFQQPRRDRPALLPGEPHRGPLRSPLPRLVRVAIAIPDEVQAGARAELDEIERRDAGPLGDAKEERREHPRALHLVRLDALLRDEAREELLVLRQRVVPLRLTAEHEVVQASGEP